MPILEIRNVSRSFSGTPALQDVSFEVEQGEIVCLLGPSGCGKTTLLRIVAGLESLDKGQVLFEGQDIGPVPPYQRDFGLMFQDYALFPHKNVYDNVAFGLRTHKGSIPNQDVAGRVHAALELVGLRGFENRGVNALSGGEAQRVALARSLAPRPRLLMLDEPLGSLDRAMRERLMGELRDILTDVGVTSLYVTHDQAEAFSIADKAVIMNAGQVEQIDQPETIYRRPACAFVARFLGMSNLAQGRVLEAGKLETEWGPVLGDTNQYRIGDSVTVLLRSEAARLLSAQQSAADPETARDQTIIRGRLVKRSFRGGHYQVAIEPEQGPPLSFEIDGVQPLRVQPGELTAIAVHPAGVVIWSTPSDRCV